MCQLCLNLRFDGHAVDRHARKLGDDLFDRVDRIGLDFGERLHLCGPDATVAASSCAASAASLVFSLASVPAPPAPWLPPRATVALARADSSPV